MYGQHTVYMVHAVYTNLYIVLYVCQMSVAIYKLVDVCFFIRHKRAQHLYIMEKYVMVCGIKCMVLPMTHWGICVLCIGVERGERERGKERARETK